VQEEASKRIINFFREFSHVEVSVVDIKTNDEGIDALCKLPDGEYQVILDKDLSVRAFYRKKPYIVETSKQKGTPTYGSTEENQTEGRNLEIQTPRPSKRPVLSNSEKAVLLLIKSNPGMTSYEIRQAVDIKFTMLLPILKKLLNQNIIRKQGEKYFPFNTKGTF